MSLDDVTSLSLKALQKYIDSIDIYTYSKSSILMYFCMLRHDYMDAFQLLVNKEYLLYTVTLVQEKYYMDEEFKIIDYILENDLQDLISEIFKYWHLFNINEMYHFAGIILQYYYFDNIDNSTESGDIDTINRLNPSGKFEHARYVCQCINEHHKSKHISILINYMKHNPKIDRIELLKESIHLHMLNLASYIMKHCCICPVLLIEILREHRYLIPLIECVELFDLIFVAYTNYLSDNIKYNILINNILCKIFDIQTTRYLHTTRNWNYDLVLYLIKLGAEIKYNHFKIIMTNFDTIDYNLIYDNLIKNKIRFNKLSKSVISKFIHNPYFNKGLIWLIFTSEYSITEISNMFRIVIFPRDDEVITNLKLMLTFRAIRISSETKLRIINSFDISTILDISEYKDHFIGTDNNDIKNCWKFNMTGLIKREYNLGNSYK